VAMNDPSSSSHQKHHRGGGGGGGGTTPATNTTNTTNNNKITPTASHEDLVAQLVRQSPSVMFNSNSNNSIAKTPSQAEFEQFFQAHAQAQAQAMMAQGNKTPSGGGGGMTQSGSGQDFTNLSPTEMMMNTNNTNVGGSAEQPPKGIPKVASLDMLRTMFFQSGMANGGTTGVPGMTPGNMLGLMQNPYGGSNPNLANLGQQFMQNMANTTTGFTPPGVGGAANGGAPTTRTGKPGRPRGSTKNGNASTTTALKSAAKGAVQKQNSKRGSMKTNDGLEALAMATAASDAKNSKKGADATNNKRAAPGATTSGKNETSPKKEDDSSNKKSKTSKDKDTGSEEDNTAELVKKNSHVQLGENEEDDDPEMAEIRRQRRMLSNRESARRSRRRKLDHVAQLEGQIASLQREQALLLERYRQSEEARETVFRENSVLKKELTKKGVDVNAMLVTNMRESASAENLANNSAGNAAAIAAAVAAGANTFMPKQSSGSISNFLMSAGPSNVNLADVGDGMLRVPSMPRVSSVGDLVKRTISSEALANFEQQQAAIAAQMASNAAGLMAGGGVPQNGASKDGASPRGFVPFRPTSSYQNLLDAAKLAESNERAEKEKKKTNGAKKGASKK
jgi:hypothetical protein